MDTLKNFSYFLIFSVVWGVSITGVFLLYKGVSLSLERSSSLMGADLIVVPEGMEKEWKELLLFGSTKEGFLPNFLMAKLKEIEGIKRVAPQLFVESATASCCSIWQILIIGIDPERDFVLDGAELMRSSGEYDPIIAGNHVGLREGVTLKFYGHRFKVVKVLDERGFGYFDNAVFIPIQVAYTLSRESRMKRNVVNLPPLDGKVSSFLVELKEKVNPEEVASKIKEKVKGVGVITSSYFVRDVKKRIKRLGKTFYFLAFYVSIMNFLVFVIVEALEKETKKKDSSVMFIMGWKAEKIKSFFLFKDVMAGVLGVLCGGVISFLFLFVVKDFIYRMEVPFVTPSMGFVFKITILLAFAVSFIIALVTVPGFSLKKEEVRRCMRS